MTISIGWKRVTGGHVEIQIRMVDAMYSPQGGHRVEHQVLEVDRQVQRQHAT